MKKALLLMAVIVTFQFTYSQSCGTSGSFQCTASGNISTPLFDGAGNNQAPLINGVSSTTVIQFKNVNTVLYQGSLTVTVNSLKIDSIGNLPAGLCWASDKANDTYANSESGCIKLNGLTCATPGVYKLLILATADVATLGNVPVDLETVGFKYFLRVKNNGDATITLDDSQTAAFAQPVGYASSAVCTPPSILSVTLGSNQTVCNGAGVVLSPTVSGSTGTVSYAWNASGNSLSCSNCQNPNATIIQNSTYTVTVSDATSATASASISYTIAAPSTEQLIASGPTTICDGDNLYLSTTNNFASYRWSNDSTTAYIKATQQGVYSVTATNNAGCSATGSISVTVNPKPATQSILGNPNIVPFQSYPYLINSVNGITYQWDVVGGGIASGQGTNSINVVWGATGPYSVTLVQTNLVGCADTSTLAVSGPSGIASVDDNAALFIYPNPATSQLFVETHGLAAEEVSIFNATGALMMQTKALLNKSIDISSLANGVYMVEIKTKEATAKRRLIKM